MGNSPVDRDSNYMKSMWETTKLVTDYIEEDNMGTRHDFLDNLANHQHQKMLREIANDAATPKKRDRKVQNDLYEKVSDNDFYEGLDYDDDMIPTAEFLPITIDEDPVAS